MSAPSHGDRARAVLADLMQDGFAAIRSGDHATAHQMEVSAVVQIVLMDGEGSLMLTRRAPQIEAAMQAMRQAVAEIWPEGGA